MTEERILCKCHRQLVRTQFVKGKLFNKKKYFCDITNRQLISNEFIYEKMKINLPNPDDTWSGDNMSPADTDNAIEDFKKKAAGNGDD